MSRIETLLNELYDTTTAQNIAARAEELIAAFRLTRADGKAPAPIDQHTAMLITYGDQVSESGQAPLHTLGEFLRAHVQDVLSAVHLLPFYPSSSDDGFSVMDYYAVDPKLGAWADVADIGQAFDLMFDAVINHASAQGEWFQRFLRNKAPYNEYFLEAPPEFDVTNVIRPRTLPLLTEVETTQGRTRVWTTFSADQVDLNYASPELLLEIARVLLFYVAHGARFLRLDAIAFLYKTSGTTCLHLPQTHAVIQWFRALLDQAAPEVILVTETNVPHADNISYFGDGTHEAQWVYNFALPPLVLHTLQTGDASALSRWAQTLETPSDTTAFFNFLASHDGVGLNPVRGILTPAEMDALVMRTLERGGLVSYKNNPDGTTSPYEMNINLLDALAVPGDSEASAIQRLLCAHAMQLALAGVPGIYFHSLFGSRGDRAGAAASGMPRRINRQKFTRAELQAELAAPDSRRAQILAGFRMLLMARGQHAAFHPHAPQTILREDPRVFAVERGAGNKRVICLHNVAGGKVVYDWVASGEWRDILSGQEFAAAHVKLPPYGYAWLVPL